MEVELGLPSMLPREWGSCHSEEEWVEEEEEAEEGEKA